MIKHISIILLFASLGSGCGDDDNTLTDASPDAYADTAMSPDTAEPDATMQMEDKLSWVLRDQKVTLTDGKSAPVRFEVPADALSVTISVSGKIEETYAVTRWRQGDDSELIDESWFGKLPACLDCQNRGLASFGSVAVIAPNNPNVVLKAGEHSFVVAGQKGDFEVQPVDGDVSVSVVIKRGEQPPTSGTLDLNFHFTGADGLNATAAKENVAIQNALAEMKTLYATANITIGEVRYLDIDAKYQTIDDDTIASEMFTIKHPDALKTAMNVFFNKTGVYGELGSANIPISVQHGTFQSGLRISIDDSGEQLPYTLAHEVGHALGLWHINDSLSDGTEMFDQLDDTGKYDANLMNSETFGGPITASQAQVMRLSRWVH